MVNDGIGYSPAIGRGFNCTAMNKTYFTVAVVFGDEAGGGAFQDGSLRPVNVEKAPGAGHLIEIVDGKGVMDEGGGEGVVPRGVGVVEVGAWVECEIEAAPP